MRSLFTLKTLSHTLRVALQRGFVVAGVKVWDDQGVRQEASLTTVVGNNSSLLSQRTIQHKNFNVAILNWNTQYFFWNYRYETKISASDQVSRGAYPYLTWDPLQYPLKIVISMGSLSATCNCTPRRAQQSQSIST